MSGATQPADKQTDLGLKLVYGLTIFMVLIGLVNSTPGIPGYDNLVASLTGIEGATFRKFPFEWFYPGFFAMMMIFDWVNSFMPSMPDSRPMPDCFAPP